MSSGIVVWDATRVRVGTGGDIGLDDVSVGEAGRGAVGGFLGGRVRSILALLLLRWTGVVRYVAWGDALEQRSMWRTARKEWHAQRWQEAGRPLGGPAVAVCELRWGRCEIEAEEVAGRDGVPGVERALVVDEGVEEGRWRDRLWEAAVARVEARDKERRVGRDNRHRARRAVSRSRGGLEPATASRVVR